MDGSRGFFYAAAGSTPAARPAQEGATPMVTRSRPVSAGTRLRQKPANSTSQPDFFASLGIDSSLRSRTGTNTSNMSNRSSSFTITRPASAADPNSSMSTSSGWTPPPIGGLGSKRSPPPLLKPTVGSLSIAGVKTHSMVQATSQLTTRESIEGLSRDEAATVVSAPPTSNFSMKSSTTSIQSNPTQLFSMEDADELYSNDGWNCDSPSTVLSYSMEDTATTTVAAAPVVATAEPSVEEFAWGDDDDAFVSPLATSMAPSVQPPPLEIAGASVTKAPTISSMETKVESRDPPQSLPPHSGISPSYTSLNSEAKMISSDAAHMPSQNMAQLEHVNPLNEASPLEREMFNTKSRHSMQVPSEETKLAFECLPPGSTPSSYLSAEPAPNASNKNSVTANEGPTYVAPPVTTNRGLLQNAKAWDQSKSSVTKGIYAMETMEESTITSIPIITTTTTTTPSDAFVAPLAELASPGDAAGEFWGGGDEEELFDYDDHANEEWDETIKVQSSPNTIGGSCENSDDSSFPGREASFSLLSQPRPLHSAPPAGSIREQEAVDEEVMVATNFVGPNYREETKEFRQECMIATTSQETVGTAQQPPTQVHNNERNLDARTAAMLVATSPPFSRAIAEYETRDDDPHVFPEAPRPARFLHTPTGTGGPFGRVPSPNGDNNSNFHDEVCGTSMSPAHDAHRTSHTTMTFPSGEKTNSYGSYTDSSVRWDSRPSPSGRLGQMSSEEQVDQRNGDSYQITRQGQSDEEERDSVVSFSEEHSFFPSAGRPSSLYEGSQSLFASHRVYTSSVASTDHDGSSIASFGVSSAGATFGGSERVSEGGAFSDGTISETPSMVDSSNASTAFGLDFVSVSEGQFSAPGTTIGGSDNASDRAFSDGNASETASLCESVNSRSPFVSDYSASSGQFITKVVEQHDLQESFAQSTPVHGAAPSFGESASAANSSLFRSFDASADEKPFECRPDLFSSSQHTSSALSGADSLGSTSTRKSDNIAREESYQSAASLFGATAGADVPNPFSSFGALPSTPTERESTDALELSTLDAKDLFGAGPPVSGFETSFAQPVNRSFSSSYQAHDQNFSQDERRNSPDSHASVFASGHDQFANSSPFDRPATASSNLNSLEPYNSHNYNSADPFASRTGTQNGIGHLVPLAGSNGEGFTGNTSIDQSLSINPTGNALAPVDAVSGGYLRSDNSVSIAASISGQSGPSYAANQGTNQYEQRIAASYLNLGSSETYKPSDRSVCAQSAGSTLPEKYGQIQGVGVNATGYYSRQSSTNSLCNSTQRKTSEFGQQSCYSDQALPLEALNDYQRLNLGRSLIPGTPDNYRNKSAADVFGSARSANQESRDYTHSRNDQKASREASNHVRLPSGASANAYFVRSSSGMVASSSSSDFSGEPMINATMNGCLQPLVQTNAQRSFPLAASSASLIGEQHGAYAPTAATAMRPVAQSHNLNPLYDPVECTSLSRNASSSSFNRYESGTSSEHQNHVQQLKENTPARQLMNASSFFGGASSATAAVTASSFFSGAASRDLSDTQMLQHNEPYESSTSYVQTTHEFALPVQQEKEQKQQYLEAETSHHKSGEYVGASSASALAQESGVTPMTAIKPTTLNQMRQRQQSFNGGDLASTAAYSMHPEVKDQGVIRPQTFNGFADSGPQDCGGQQFSDFASSSSAPQAHDTALSYNFEQSGYRHHNEQELTQVYGAASASLQPAETFSAYSHTSGSASSGGISVRAPAAHLAMHSSQGAYGAGAPNFAISSQHQAPQYEHNQQHQQQSQNLAANGYGNHSGLKKHQTVTANYHAPSIHEYGYAVKRGQGMMSEPQVLQSRPAPVMMTSNKYKDPCVAPPSCLVSFGFGGNLVTMFPKRKLRLNIAGSSFRNSPRGATQPSDFENSGNGELRKGPVHLYRMDQFHPKDKNYMKMDTFPGPLTESVSDEAILEYIDDRLKCSDAPKSAVEAEDENDRLLLGVLRILVKCNGKLRSDPGTLKSNDCDSPEAQLIALLSESSKRHSGKQGLTFPAPRYVQSTLHPDLMPKHVNQLRELLLLGDRKVAVSTAMSAHMWPEAMLIASFTDKEEYRRVLCTYLDETYAIGDPNRTLFMSFADQQEKSVQEPKRLLQMNAQQPTDSFVLSSWVSHAQVLIANRTADTNKILIELGDRLWNEANVVGAAHICYLLAGIQVEAPIATSKIALLGGDHRTPSEARFYVSPGAVQLTEIYEWAHKYSKSASANLMIPFQGYKLIYAMLLADHGKLETSFKYVTSMLTVIKAVTATMKPGTSMYLEGLKNQLTVLDDRLRQHLGQDRVASVAASTNRGAGSKQGKWGIGSALSIMGKIVNRVVEGNDTSTAAPSGSSATPSGGLYANEATPSATTYPSASSVTGTTLSSMPPHMQQHAQQSSSPQLQTTLDNATPPVSQGSAPGSSNGYTDRAIAPPAKFYARPGASGIPPSGPFSGNGRPGLKQQQPSGPFSGNGRPGSAGQLSSIGPGPFLHSQPSMEPPGSNRSTHSNSSVSNMSSAPTTTVPQYQLQHAPPTQQQQPPSSQTSKLSQNSLSPQTGHVSRPAFQKPAPLDLAGGNGLPLRPKALSTGLVAEGGASLSPPDAAIMSGPSSDKGRASPKVKRSARSKTPPPSGSSKGSGWLSGLSSFIATKMNPEAKVAKLGEQMEAYFDEEKKCWVFPGETSTEEPVMPSAPPTGPMPGSAPGSSATGIPPMGTNSAPGSMSSGPAPSNDPLAALMAPPPSYGLMKKDPLAAMMAPPLRPGLYGARGSTPQRKPPRPHFAVLKPSAASAEE